MRAAIDISPVVYLFIFIFLCFEVMQLNLRLHLYKRLPNKKVQIFIFISWFMATTISASIRRDTGKLGERHGLSIFSTIKVPLTIAPSAHSMVPFARNKRAVIKDRPGGAGGILM